MATTFDRKKLLGDLKKIKGSLADKDFIPVYTHFCFDSDNSVIYAFNDVMASMVEHDVEFDSLAIPGKILLNVLNGMSGDSVTIETKKEELIIKSGKSRAKLPYLEDDSFIFELPSDKECKWEIPIDKDFIKGITLCCLSIGDDSVHSNHKGITLVSSEDSGYLYSTNNRTVSRYDLEELEEDISIFLPKEFCYELLVRYNEEAEYSLKIGKEFVILFEDDSPIIYSKIEAETELEDFEAIFKKYSKGFKDKGYKVNQTFVDSISRSLSMLESESVKRTKAILEGGKLKLVTTTDQGNLTDEVKFNSKGKDELGFCLPPDMVLLATKEMDNIIFKDDVIIMKTDSFVHLIAHCSF